MKEQYTGLVIRLVAFFIDSIILVFLNTICASLIMALIKIIFSGVNVNSFKSIGLVSFSTFFIVFLLYFAFGESSKWRGTFGKRVTKMIVVTQTGEKMTFFKAIIRALLKLVSVMSIFGCIIIPFTKRKQGMHDFITNTVVIYQQ